MNKRILALCVTAAVVVTAGAAAAATGTSSSTTSDFNPIASTRILDTRTTGGPVTGHKTISFSLGSAVPADATAVAVNVTVISSNTIGYVLAYPDGAARPTTSSVDFEPRQTIANEVTVPVSDGKIDLFNGGVGPVQIIVDLEGYYTPTAAPVSTTWTLPTANQSITTGGSAVSNATQIGTVTLAAGTYQVSLNAKATPTMTSTVQVFPAFFVYNQTLSGTFAGDEFNVGSGALESGGNTNIDSYFSGSGVVTVPAGGETLHLYAFGYDSDRGSGTYMLDTASLTAVPLAGTQAG